MADRRRETQLAAATLVIVTICTIGIFITHNHVLAIVLKIVVAACAAALVNLFLRTIGR